ncbi:Cell division control protein 2-like C, partial [Mucuna pruriens]
MAVMEKSENMEKYEKMEKVGEGTYEKVYKAWEKANWKVVALKKTYVWRWTRRASLRRSYESRSTSSAFSRWGMWTMFPSPRRQRETLTRSQSCSWSFRISHLKNLLLDHHKSILKIADLGLDHAFIVPLKSYTHEIVTL